MGKCKRCHVRIADDTQVCPLCNTVLTTESGKGSRVYPDVQSRTRWMKRLLSICIYILAVAQIVFCVVNYYTFRRLSWSLITGVCIAYAIFVLFYSFYRRDSHIRKLSVQVSMAAVFLLLLDLVTGAKGWSVVYGMPCLVLSLDVVLIILMLANFHNWQSYLLVQLYTLLMSAVLLVLYLTGVTKNPALPWVSFGVSAIIFSFCFIVGNRKAKNELKRRFYI